MADRWTDHRDIAARISHVPVCLANHLASGHGGTYGEPNGGDYGQLMLDWLDWHLQGRRVEKPGKGLYIKNGKKEVVK